VVAVLPSFVTRILAASTHGLGTLVRFAFRWGMVLLLGSLVTSHASAGVIRGTLRIGKSRVQASPASSKGAAAKASRSLTSAVVYLDSIPQKSEMKLLAEKIEPARMGQAYGKFVPSTLAVAVGTTVEFENQDRVYHSVFSLSPVKKFDLGKYAPRESRKIRLDKLGEIRVFCDIDPGETGTVFVVPNHAFTQPDESGAFELPKLPPGKYQLRVWAAGKRLTRAIEIPRKGDVTLELQL